MARKDLLSFIVSMFTSANGRFDFLLQEITSRLPQSITKVLTCIKKDAKEFTLAVSSHFKYLNKFIREEGNIWGVGVNKERSDYYEKASHLLDSALKISQYSW